MRRIVPLSIMGMIWVSGCAEPLKPVFKEIDPPLVWPKPPDKARIRYIGELRGEESLAAPRTGLQVLGEAFSGPKQKVPFVTPMAVALHGDNVFVADGQAHSVFNLNLETRRFQAIRQAAGKPLEWPIDLAVWGDEIVVADSKMPGVFVFDMEGRYLRAVSAPSLMRPSAVAVNRSSNDLWVLDTAAHDCKVFGRDGTLVRTFGGRGGEAGKFNFPAGLTVDGTGRVAVADSMNFRVQLLAADGASAGMFGKKGDGAGDFALPRDAAFDSAEHVYVLDNQFENVQIFDQKGGLLMAFGQEGRGPGEFALPSGITIDEQDRIWIADTYNRRVQVFQYLREVEP